MKILSHANVNYIISRRALRARVGIIRPPSRAIHPGWQRCSFVRYRRVSIAIGSASEARYLVELAVRLQFADEQDGKRLISGYTRVIGALQALITSLEAL